MKKIKFYFFLFLFCCCCGCNNKEKKFDQCILVDAKYYVENSDLSTLIENNPFSTENRKFDITKISNNKISVNNNGNIVTLDLYLPKATDYKPQNISNIKNLKHIKNSFKLIFEYIEASNILKDKDKIKEYIKSLSVKEASYTADSSAGAYFSPEDNTLYINRENKKYICEWMIVHELFHAVAYATHDYKMDNEEYPFNLFNEVVTDILTASLNPKIPENITSGYALYYEMIYPYMDIFQTEAIKSFFYGYKSIYNKISKEEMDLFVLCVENYTSTEAAAVFYTNLILKWYAAAK